MKLNVKYTLMQGFYWMLFCVLYSYATFYLTSRDMSITQIGFLMALGGLISALSQTALGRFIDEKENWNWKNVLTVLSILTIIAFGSWLVIPKGMVSGVVYCITIIFVNCMMPLVNAANFNFVSAGKKVNYGIARGFGSMTYSTISLVLGRLTTDYGAIVLPYVGIIVAICLFISILFLPYYQEQKSDTSVKRKPTQMNQFVQKYYPFILMILGMAFCMAFHNIANTYKLQVLQSVGGGTEELGRSVFIMGMVEIPVLFGSVYILKKFKAGHLLWFSSVAYLFKALAFLFAKSITMVYLGDALQIFSYAFFAAFNVFYADEQMEEDDRVTGQGMAAAISTLSGVIGNLVGGILYDSFGVHSMLQVGVGLTLLGILCTSLSVYLSKRKRTEVRL